MDKKALLPVLLLVLWFVFQDSILDFIFGPPPKPAPGMHATNAAPVRAKPIPAATVLTTPDSLASRLKNTSSSEKTAVLENDAMRVNFTSRGGGISTVELKHFALPEEGNTILNSASPLSVLAVEMGDLHLNDSWQLTSDANTVRAQFTSPSGLQAVKQFSLTNDYQVAVTLTVKNTGKATVQNPLQLALGMAGHSDVGDEARQASTKSFKSSTQSAMWSTYLGISYLGAEKVHHQYLPGIQKFVSKQQKPWVQVEAIQWAAVKNQYFTLLTTPNAAFQEIQAEPYEIGKTADGKSNQGVLASIRTTPLALQPGASTNWTFLVYAGPKEYARLSTLGNRQGDVLDLSWAAISHTLLSVMTAFHGVFHNWGVAIIAVTLLIKILLWPLTAISTRNMKQMQALSPKMNVIKEKYKDDSKKMNEEMMKLYRDYRVNPLAGCLPMLVQIPIFFAFYSMLRSSIELRGAHFLWIHDLSLPDTIAFIPGTHMPINLMPLVMAVTMIWQTKITPQAPSADPSMKMMMWFMPLTFLYFCYNFSSGLSLYWTVQNLLTILQTVLSKDKPAEPPQKIKRGGGSFFGRSRDNRK